jgi:hypothetical protein
VRELKINFTQFLLRMCLLVASIVIYLNILKNKDFPLYAVALIVLVALLLFAMERARRHSKTRMSSHDQLHLLATLPKEQLAGELQGLLTQAGFTISADLGEGLFLMTREDLIWGVYSADASQVDKVQMREILARFKPYNVRGVKILSPHLLDGATKKLAALRKIQVFDMYKLWKLLEATGYCVSSLQEKSLENTLKQSEEDLIEDIVTGDSPSPVS